MEPAVELLDENDRRSCWVCFANDEDDLEASWVEPCKCKGTTKWVHQLCLQRWIDEKQRDNQTQRVNCPQCNTQYLIFVPKFGRFVYVLDFVDKTISRFAPALTIVIAVGALYWTAVSYGGVVVLLTSKQEEGASIMDLGDPVLLYLALPLIPPLLIVAKMVQWEKYLLKLWWRHSWRIRDMRGLYSSLRGELPGNTVVEPPEVLIQMLDRPRMNEHGRAARVLVSGLCLPFESFFMGLCFSPWVRDPLHRTFLGGFSSIMLKGFLRIYLWHEQMIRQLKRRVLNYGDDLKVDAEEQD